MSHPPLASADLSPVPVRSVVPWAVLICIFSLLILYLLGIEQGAFSIFSGRYVHEFLHDGRHLLGIPCH